MFDVRIVPSDETVAGKGVNQAGIILKEGSPIVDELPDQVDGVSVTVEERESFDLRLQSHSLCYNNGDYDYAWGGVAVQSDADDDGTVDYNGTGCCPVKRDGTEYYLTANHLFLSGDSCEGNWSDDLWQHSKSSANYLGEVYRYREKMDFAIVGPIEMSPVYDIKNARWSGYIKSHATKKRCQEMMGDGTTVAKMGITTGEETGTIATLEATFSYGCIDLGGNGIGIDADCANGDSGGPYYAESEASSGDIAIVGCHSGTPNWLSNGSECGNDTYSRAAGAPAYHMASELNLTFGI